MSSSPSPQSARQAPVFASRQQQIHEYRQIAYRDGGNVQIAESRRPTWADRMVEASVQTYTDFVLYPKENKHSHLWGGFEEVSSQPHPARPRGAAGPSSEVHVTSAKHSSKVKLKPVILHAEAKSSQRVPLEGKVAVRSSASPTPPLTPRLGRLSTPELSDLDEAPFCDCGVASHVFKRCTNCNVEIDLW
ncbi:hypothetical protein G6011_07058 [Alternaria panax]|uniref:Uncharacterized protein n=1 Tax=Alternaria panax TaxID=48097 RepID=A0AAD4I561_9PLEO|nr:hypothetical protein G6011_07058 [Alternaria panax]